MRKIYNIFIVIVIIVICVITFKPDIIKTFSSDDINEDINLDIKHIYLVVGESYKLEDKGNNVKVSCDSDIITITDTTIEAQKVGSADVVFSNASSKDTLTVEVTDLLIRPVIDNKKAYLKCKQYTEEEAQKLDDLLAYRIQMAGYNTRAGAVAAARFLALEFPYRIAYFYENGRLLTNGERRYVDGEGRYYHRGLYLDASKFNDLAASDAGPAIWGCPLYSHTTGIKSANGLDCSGYVSWALYNAGFDVGDAGAGISAKKTNDLDDLGEKVANKAENLERLKVGDLLSRYGHIGILIGYDTDHYYVAEALDNDLHVNTYTVDELLHSDWVYFLLLDNLYLEDGNLTNMWS